MVLKEIRNKIDDFISDWMKDKSNFPRKIIIPKEEFEKIIDYNNKEHGYYLELKDIVDKEKCREIKYQSAFGMIKLEKQREGINPCMSIWEIN